MAVKAVSFSVNPSALSGTAPSFFDWAFPLLFAAAAAWLNRWAICTCFPEIVMPVTCAPRAVARYRVVPPTPQPTSRTRKGRWGVPSVETAGASLAVTIGTAVPAAVVVVA